MGHSDMEAESISVSGIGPLAGGKDYSVQSATQPELPKAASSAPGTRAKAAPELPSRDEILKAANGVGQALANLNHGIRFQIDESTHRIITQIIDRQTNEVIRQIPAQEIVEMAHRLRQYMGVLLNLKV